MYNVTKVSYINSSLFKSYPWIKVQLAEVDVQTIKTIVDMIIGFTDEIDGLIDTVMMTNFVAVRFQNNYKRAVYFQKVKDTLNRFEVKIPEYVSTYIKIKDVPKEDEGPFGKRELNMLMSNIVQENQWLSRFTIEPIGYMKNMEYEAYVDIVCICEPMVRGYLNLSMKLDYYNLDLEVVDFFLDKKCHKCQIFGHYTEECNMNDINTANCNSCKSVDHEFGSVFCEELIKRTEVMAAQTSYLYNNIKIDDEEFLSRKIIHL